MILIYMKNIQFKLFPSLKIDFWPFLKLQKNGFWSKKIFFREIDLFDFTSFFFGPGLFLNFLANCEVGKTKYIVLNLTRTKMERTLLKSGRSNQKR